MNGILLLDKPLNLSSNQALQRVKRLVKAKKAGHTGSLDVLATGLLPICLGEATKFSHFLLDADKRYLTTGRLGQRTTTCDAEGEVVETRDVNNMTEEAVQNVLKQFRGPLKQVPSMYSALKHQGHPLYKLARQGKEVERKARDIVIHELLLGQYNLPDITLSVHCSKGTYIRNLVDDIGQALACGAYVTMLRRTAVAGLNIEQAINLEQLADMPKETIAQHILPMDLMLEKLPSLALTQSQLLSLVQGKLLELSLPGEMARLYCQDVFVGVAERIEGKTKVKRLLSNDYLTEHKLL